MWQCKQNVVVSLWCNSQDKSFDHFLGFMNLEDGDEHWIRPIDNKIKINTEYAIFSSSGCYNCICC